MSYKSNFDKIKWTGTQLPLRKRPYDGAHRSHLAMPYISGDYKPYECPVTGKVIDGRREHEENLRLHDCRIHEKGEFEDVKKNGQTKINAEIDAAIDASVDAIAGQVDF
jgi:hypothetical protein|tara:strand:- start:179 stop:505 length:327 start_codon:yes stop_codon:yes gene_type:complete